MSVAYCLHYSDDGYRTLGVEVPFDLPIYDPVTSKPIGRNYCGVVDCILEQDGKVYFGDHKTASKIDDNYWRELKTNAQLSTYMLAAMQCGIEVEGFVWDVILKPTISPKTLTKAAKEELEGGTYCGYPVCDYNGETEETPKLYGLRCLSEYIKNPERFFQRRTITRTREQILDCLIELRTVANTMTHVEKEPVLQYPNRSACKSFGSLCDFHSICAGDDPERLRYQPRQKREEGPQFAENAVSHSQQSCFLRCRREWTHRYLDKIEPLKPEYRDSLYMGTMVHKSLELFLASRPAGRTITLTQSETVKGTPEGNDGV